MNPYDVLGVRNDATDGEIKRAYKRKAMRDHPDRGGSAETFQQTARAYRLLSDRSRREHYDKTGEAVDPNADDYADLVERVYHLISQTVDSCPELAGLDTNDVIEVARNAVRERIGKIEEEVARAKLAAKKRERVIKRLVRKKKLRRDDIIRQVLEAGIKDAQEIVVKAEKAIKDEVEVLSVLAEYSYYVATAPQFTTQQSIIAGLKHR